jgi:hypothetical protein
MSKVNDVKDAVNEGQPERDQSIDGTGQEAVNDGLRDDIE